MSIRAVIRNTGTDLIRVSLIGYDKQRIPKASVPGKSSQTYICNLLIHDYMVLEGSGKTEVIPVMKLGVFNAPTIVTGVPNYVVKVTQCSPVIEEYSIVRSRIPDYLYDVNVVVNPFYPIVQKVDVMPSLFLGGKEKKEKKQRRKPKK
jgi:hypothetical protein